MNDKPRLIPLNGSGKRDSQVTDTRGGVMLVIRQALENRGFVIDEYAQRIIDEAFDITFSSVVDSMVSEMLRSGKSVEETVKSAETRYEMQRTKPSRMK